MKTLSVLQKMLVLPAILKFKISSVYTLPYTTYSRVRTRFHQYLLCIGRRATARTKFVLTYPRLFFILQRSLLTKTTAAQNEVALSYYKVRGLYFVGVVFAVTVHKPSSLDVTAGSLMSQFVSKRHCLT